MHNTAHSKFLWSEAYSTPLGLVLDWSGTCLISRCEFYRTQHMLYDGSCLCDVACYVYMRILLRFYRIKYALHQISSQSKYVHQADTYIKIRTSSRYVLLEVRRLQMLRNACSHRVRYPWYGYYVCLCTSCCDV